MHVQVLSVRANDRAEACLRVLQHVPQSKGLHGRTDSKRSCGIVLRIRTKRTKETEEARSKKCLISLERGVASGVCAQIVDLDTEGCAEWL